MGHQRVNHRENQSGTAGRVGQGLANDGYLQRDLHGRIQRNPEEFWGDRIRPKEENHLRIAFQNINRFPMYASDPKNDSIRAFVKGINADIVGMAEMGICWHRLPTKERIWERTRGWFETLKTSVGYNKKEKKPNTVQWGGTSIWSINNAAHRATESGSDPLGL